MEEEKLYINFYAHFSFLFFHFKVTVVEVDRWYVGIPGMDDGTDAAGEEGQVLALRNVLASRVHLLDRRGGKDAVHHGDVHAGLWKKVYFRRGIMRCELNHLLFRRCLRPAGCM